MIRHVVIFQCDEAKASQEELEGIKCDLEKLVDLIPELLKIEVGVNMNSAEKQHISLIADTEDMAALDAYSKHPEHVKVGTRLRKIMTGRTCVDYTI